MDAALLKLWQLQHHPFKAGARPSSATSLANTSWTKVGLQSVDFDPNSNFDHTTNFRYTAPVTGYYEVVGCVTVTTFPCFAAAGIYVNGSIVAVGDGIEPGTSDFPRTIVRDQVHLNATDYVELWCYQHSAGAVNCSINTGETFLRIVFVSPG